MKVALILACVLVVGMIGSSDALKCYVTPTPPGTPTLIDCAIPAEAKGCSVAGSAGTWTFACVADATGATCPATGDQKACSCPGEECNKVLTDPAAGPQTSPKTVPASSSPGPGAGAGAEPAEASSSIISGGYFLVLAAASVAGFYDVLKF